MNHLGNYLLIICILLLPLVFQVESGSPVYTVLSPFYMYLSSVYKINIFHFPDNNETSTIFDAIIRCGQDQLQTIQVENATSDSITLKGNQVGEIVFETSDVIVGMSCKLSITADTDGDISQRTATISIIPNDLIFIRTDKTLYMPRETVHFRIQLGTKYFKPKSDRIHVRIRDSYRNVLKSWQDVTTNSVGIYSSKFEISDRVNFGQWRLEATLANQSNPATVKSFAFAVRELQEPPKFDIQIDLPHYLILSDLQNVTMKIRAIYSSGEKLNGTCNVEVVLLSSSACIGNSRQNLLALSFPIGGTSSQVIELHKYIQSEVIADGSKLDFRVNVTEFASNRSFVSGRSVILFLDPYQIMPSPIQEFYKPRLPFHIDFKILDHDNQLLANLNDTATVKHNFEDGAALLNLPIQHGIIKCEFLVKTNRTEEKYIEVNYKNISYRYIVPERKGDVNRDSIMIQQLELEEKNQTLKILVKSTSPLHIINYVMVNLGVVYALKTVELPKNSTEFFLDISVPPNLQSEAKLIVFTHVNKHYISDSLELPPKNRLDVTPSKTSLKPSENVILKMGSIPNATIFLQAQSLDVSRKDLAETAMQKRYPMWILSMKDHHDFQQSGLIVLSNARESPDKTFRDFRDPYKEVCRGNQSGSFHGEDEDLGRFEPDMVRNNFNPKFWLWNDYPMGNSSNLNVEVKMPDTESTWTISGQSIHPHLGVGYLRPFLKLRTLKDFVVTFDVPYSMVLGEKLFLNVEVQNRWIMAHNRSANITVLNTNGDFLFGKGYNEIKTIQNLTSTARVSFLIIPAKAGELLLEIRATTEDAEDTVSKILLVVPRGVKEILTMSKIMEATGKANMTWTKIEAMLPPNRINGADSLRLSFSTDVMSLSVKNLGNLFEDLVESGQENIFKMATTIILLNHLRSQKNPELQNKALRLLELGYQKQLTFARDDGSFSLFGRSDPKGSTWLTAYVIRYLLASRSFITIDNRVIEKGLKFLQRLQGSNGQFLEHGVVSPSIYGNEASAGVAVTVMCSLAFLEAIDQGLGENRTRDVITKAVRFYRSYGDEVLENPDSETDLFAFSLVIYAEEVLQRLEVDKENRNDKYFKFMDDRATTFKNFHGDHLRYWSNFMDGETMEELDGTSINVEITSYVLATYLLRGKVGDSLPILKWLLQHQNQNGGFISMQDTVVALTALAKYSEVTQNAAKNLHVQVGISSPNPMETHVELIESPVSGSNNNNSILLKKLKSPNPHSSEKIYVSMAGKGRLFLKASWTQYFEEPENQEYFNVTVSRIDLNELTLDLMICTAYMAGPQSNVAFVEVSSPSGYIFDSDSLTFHEANYEKHEFDKKNTRLNICFDSVPHESETCLNVRATKLYRISNPAPSLIKIWDYFEPTKISMVRY